MIVCVSEHDHARRRIELGHLPERDIVWTSGSGACTGQYEGQHSTCDVLIGAKQLLVSACFAVTMS